MSFILILAATSLTSADENSGKCLFFEFIDENGDCRLCPPGCLCTSESKCTECLDFYYLNDNSTCSRCSIHCRKCKSKIACQECALPYQLNVDLECEIFEGNCLYNPETHKCSSCDSDFYLTENFKCKLNCTLYCEECEPNTRCTKCKYGYFLIEEFGECFKCNYPCYNCTSYDSCIYALYSMTPSSTKYSLCNVDRCSECDNFGCLKCKDEYYSVKIGNYLLCCPINCLTCNEQQCLTCTSPFTLNNLGRCGYYSYSDFCSNTHYLENGHCFPCSHHIYACETCESKKKCTKCEIGSYLRDGFCYLCTSQGCEICSEFKCYQCRVGYFIYDFKTEECHQNSRQCTSLSKCVKCLEGYFHDGICDRCPDYCKYCISSSECSYCRSPFDLDPVTKQCYFYYDENCIEFNRNGCLACAESYFLIGKLCVFNNCNEFSKDGECINCKQNYILNNGKCESKDDCVGFQYSSNRCLMCEPGPGYYLGNDGKCHRCPQNCTNCFTDKICLFCTTGYRVTYLGLCIPCSENCNFCDETGCVACTPTFTNINGSCVCVRPFNCSSSYVYGTNGEKDIIVEIQISFSPISMISILLLWIA